MGVLTHYLVPFTYIENKQEHIIPNFFVPDADMNPKFAAYINSCLHENKGEDFGEADRIVFIQPDTRERHPSLPLRPPWIHEFLQHIGGNQWHLIFSINCRRALFHRLLREADAEAGEGHVFSCWNPEELREWLLKLARVLIRYPDDTTTSTPDWTCWRNRVLANGNSEMKAPDEMLTLLSIIDTDNSNIEPVMIC